MEKREIQPNDLYTKNGFDFRVHFIQNDQVYGCLYRSKDRGDLDAEKDWYQFKRRDIDLFESEGPELVVESVTTGDTAESRHE